MLVSFSVSRIFFSALVEQELGGRAEAVGADAEDRVLGLLVLAELGADAGEQHRQLEGLGDIVVGAGVEAVDLVAVGGVAGQHQDRALDALLAQQPAELAAVHVGQADVEDDEVVVLLAGAGEAAVAVAGLEDVELLGQHQLVGQRLAQVGVVVDEEDLLHCCHVCLSFLSSSCWFPTAGAIFLVGGSRQCVRQAGIVSGDAACGQATGGTCMGLGLTALERLARARSDLRMGAAVALRDGGGAGAGAGGGDGDGGAAGGRCGRSGRSTWRSPSWRAATLKARAYDGDVARVALPADADLDWVRATADPSADLAWPMKGPYRDAARRRRGAAPGGDRALQAGAPAAGGAGGAAAAERRRRWRRRPG